MVILRGIKLGSALGALVLFFLPWVEIQCSGKSLATQTGWQITTGEATPAKVRDAERDMVSQERASELGKARLVAAALLATGFAVLLLLLALVGQHPVAEGGGVALCGLALLLLVNQAVEGFPVKDMLVQSASVDDASLNTDMDSFGDSMAMAVMAGFEIRRLPAFYASCLLLGIPVLLTIARLLIHGSAIHASGAS